MIELRKISAGYRGEPVLRDVDLVFPAGCVTVLLGPKGCGKSTLLKTALGLLPALSGEVLYDGAPLSGMPPEQVARRAAYMAQSRNVPSIEARRMVLHGATAKATMRPCGARWKRRTRWSWRTVRCRS